MVFFLAAQSSASAADQRYALVIGNASYEARRLNNPANDAELVARTLQAAGFEVSLARDLKQDALRQAFNGFLDTLRKAGPNSIALVYFAGYGLQLDGDNYLLPIDAKVVAAADVPRYGVEISGFMHKLSALRMKAATLVLDAARQGPFLVDGRPPAAGLAWLEPDADTLIAFDAAPGMYSPDVAQNYGPYAKALAEMINEAGFTPSEIFLRVRLRVHELTGGAQVPWDNSGLGQQAALVERGGDPARHARSLERVTWMRSQAMADLSPQEAYLSALIRDTFDAYADFLADHRRDPLGKRVLAMLAARREAITWRRTCQADTPEAYWTYMERYPGGAHGADARRRLERQGASTTAPAKFRKAEYDVPPPLPDELDYSGRSPISLADASFSPVPARGLREIMGDPPEFAFRSASAVANVSSSAIPAPVASRPAALPKAGPRDSSLDFDTMQMRPSIDDRTTKADLPPAQPSGLPAKAGLTSEPAKSAAAAGATRALGSSGSIRLPFWASLDPPSAGNPILGADMSLGAGALPSWVSYTLIPRDTTDGAPVWTGSLAEATGVMPVPTGLARVGRRWVMLTPESAIPLPLARPVGRWSVLDRANPSRPSSSPPQATRPDAAPSASAGPAPSLPATVRSSTPNRRANTAAVSNPANARAGFPAGTSSTVTAGSR